jgi:hypothetical protein
MTIHGHERGTKKFENDTSKFIKSIKEQVARKPSDLAKECEQGLDPSLPKPPKGFETNIMKAEVTAETQAGFVPKENKKGLLTQSSEVTGDFIPIPDLIRSSQSMTQ